MTSYAMRNGYVLQEADGILIGDVSYSVKKILELEAHRRASQAAPAEEWEACTCGPCPLHPATPAPSDGLREALEECDCCVDGLQADGETPCPYCTKPRVPVVDAAEALLEAHKSGAWLVGKGRTLEQVAMIIAALRAALSTPTEERQ